MVYQILSENQKQALIRAIKGQTVHDLGACDLILTRELVKLGAKQVIAIDKKPVAIPYSDEPIQLVTGYFVDYQTPIDIAFVAWPHQDPIVGEGLVNLINRARIVIYLGKNTDGIACGFADFFKALLKRDMINYVPNRANTLIIYEKKLKVARYPRGEEFAALTRFTHPEPWSYAEIEHPNFNADQFECW